MHTKTLAIRISPAEREALRQRAAAEQVSQGDLVRRALRAYGVTPSEDPPRSITITTGRVNNFTKPRPL